LGRRDCSFAEDDIDADYAHVMAESIGPIARFGKPWRARRRKSALADERTELFSVLSADRQLSG
jgi:hypothetical protein